MAPALKYTHAGRMFGTTDPDVMSSALDHDDPELAVVQRWMSKPR